MCSTLFSVRGDATASGTGVIMKKKAENKPNSSGQIWFVGRADNDGWFSLRHCESKRFLAAGSDSFTTIIGT